MLQTSVDVSHVVTHHSTKSPQLRLTSQFGMGYGAFGVVWTFAEGWIMGSGVYGHIIGGIEVKLWWIVDSLQKVLPFWKELRKLWKKLERLWKSWRLFVEIAKSRRKLQNF